MADYQVSSFGQMLQKIGSGVSHMAEAAQTIQDRKVKMQQLQQDMEAKKQELSQAKVNAMLGADALLTKSQLEIGQYTDKKDQEAYINQKLPTINAQRQAAGLPPLDPQDVYSGGEGFAKRRSAYAQVYQTTYQKLNDPSVSAADKVLAIGDLDKALSDNSSAFSDKDLASKAEANKNLRAMMKDKLDQEQALEKQNEQNKFTAAENEKNRANARGIATTKAESKTPPENAETRKIGMTLGEDYAKSLKNIPQVKNQIKNLESGLALVGKIGTGPIVGQRAAYFAQKLSKDDAQRLEYYLAKENVIAVMQYAKEAGVRSIDTEAEQQRLLKSIANKEQSPAVLKDVFESMIRVQKETLRLTEAKQKWRAAGNSLESFKDTEEGGTGTSAPKPPEKGAVENGFVFQGGDPSKPENWKKQ